MSIESGIKRRDLGLAGTLVVIIDALSSYQSSRFLSTDVNKLKDEVIQMRLDSEKYFVKKTEMSIVVNKLDTLNTQITQLDQTLRDYGYRVETEAGIVGCDYKKTSRHGAPDHGF